MIYQIYDMNFSRKHYALCIFLEIISVELRSEDTFFIAVIHKYANIKVHILSSYMLLHGLSIYTFFPLPLQLWDFNLIIFETLGLFNDSLRTCSRRGWGTIILNDR